MNSNGLMDRTGIWLALAAHGWCVGFLLVAVGCSPPRGVQPVQPVVEEPKSKAPATTAYGKALEAAEKLKDQAQEYNDKLEKLNDPFAK
jgi:hypothetical protein